MGQLEALQVELASSLCSQQFLFFKVADMLELSVERVADRRQLTVERR